MTPVCVNAWTRNGRRLCEQDIMRTRPAGKFNVYWDADLQLSGVERLIVQMVMRTHVCQFGQGTNTRLPVSLSSCTTELLACSHFYQRKLTSLPVMSYIRWLRRKTWLIRPTPSDVVDEGIRKRRCAFLITGALLSPADAQTGVRSISLPVLPLISTGDEKSYSLPTFLTQSTFSCLISKPSRTYRIWTNKIKALMIGLCLPKFSTVPPTNVWETIWVLGTSSKWSSQIEKSL